jgi:uncharacterized protein (TIGR04206 family)
MSSKTYCTVTALIFTLIGIAHLVRLAVGFTFQIGSVVLPRTVSSVGAVVALALAVWGFKAARTSATGA